MPKIKICGLKYPANIREVAVFEPDFMGFIFYPQSPRYVGPGFVMPADVPAKTARVGVFVNQQPETILQVASAHKLTHIQLHGYESPDDCYILYKHGYSLIKAFGVDAAFNFDVLKPYLDVTDYFLFDTRSKQYGGSGRAFNWTVLEKYTWNKPFFLSGGLSPALLKANGLPRHPCLFALDVNSGVEDEPGLKNTTQIQNFIHIVKNLLVHL